MSRQILGSGLAAAIGEAFDLDPRNVRRVVVDINQGQPTVVHVEQYGDERVVDVIRELGGMRVERVDRAAGE